MAQVAASLKKVINDPKMTVTPGVARGPLAAPLPLDPKVMDPAKALVAKYFPGVPLIPEMLPAATDAVYLDAAGIPTYGVPGGWSIPTKTASMG